MRPPITLFNFAKTMAEGPKDIHTYALILASPVKSGAYHAVTGININRALKTVVLTTDLMLDSKPVEQSAPEESPRGGTPTSELTARIAAAWGVSNPVDPLIAAKAPECNHFWLAIDNTHSQCSKCGAIEGGGQ